MNILPDNIISLILVELSEPEANALRLVAVKLSPQGEPIPNPDAPKITGVALLPTPGASAIEITWDITIAYVVMNESYAVFRDDLPKPAKNLELRSDPVLDTFIAKQTFATQEFPGPFKTWAFYSENHVVLVASTSEPAIREIDLDPSWLDKPRPSIFVRS